MNIPVKYSFGQGDPFNLSNIAVIVNNKCNHQGPKWDEILTSGPIYIGDDDKMYQTTIQVCSKCGAWYDPIRTEWIDND